MKNKNNLKNAINIFSLLFIVFVLNSCSNILDINEDPNKSSDANPATLLTASEVNLGYILGGNVTRMSANIVQHYAGHRGQPLEYSQYEITSSATDNLWTNIYDVMNDMRRIQEKTKASGDKIYLGISQLLEAYTMSVTTDLFGDVPYSDALKNFNRITPSYDKQEIIYTNLLKLVDEGIVNVKSGQGDIDIPKDNDVIFSGNAVKWERFGNSLKLRLLNHLSKKNSGAAKAFLDTNPNLIISSSDNALIKYGNSPSNANPIYQFDVLSGRKDNAVCNTIVDKMKAINDPRIPLFFAPIKNGNLAGQITGNPPGNDEDDSGEAKFSRVGPAYASSDSPVILISAAEVNFIKSEIYKRAGDDVNAKIYYELAIKEDFSSLKLSEAEATAYLIKPQVLYNNTLERIMEQKWITMFQSSYESWVDWRRTGFPVLSPATINRTSGVIPRKLSLPQLELNLNSANVKAGPGIPVPFVTLTQKVWWDQ